MVVQRKKIIQGPPTVKVVPANEQMAMYLKHPVTKTGFASMNSFALWPDDAFTKRRIRDGDVKVSNAIIDAAQQKQKEETAVKEDPEEASAS